MRLMLNYCSVINLKCSSSARVRMALRFEYIGVEITSATFQITAYTIPITRCGVTEANLIKLQLIN